MLQEYDEQDNSLRSAPDWRGRAGGKAV